MLKRKDEPKGQLPMQSRMLPVTSINVEARTFDVTWTTGAGVVRYDYWTGQNYSEELQVDDSSIDLTRLNNGAPLLNSHQRYRLEDQIGVVEKAWIENGEGRATIRFSRRTELDGLWRDVQDGVIRNISVGYRVNEYQVTERVGEMPIYRAVDWEPMELSLVSVPADAQSQIRGEGSNDGESPSQLYPVNFVIRELPSDNSGTQNPEGESEMWKKLKRGVLKDSEPGNEGAVGLAQQKTVDAEQARAEGIKIERQRQFEITTLCRKHSVDEELSRKLIADGANLEQARSQILDALAARSQSSTSAQPRGHIETVVDETETRMEHMSEAILHRMAPGKHKLTDGARQYAGQSMLRMAEDALVAQGIRVRGMSRADIAQRAMHTTSDFPKILANVGSKRLLASYQQAEPTYRT
jgi:hypothetical protein